MADGINKIRTGHERTTPEDVLKQSMRLTKNALLSPQDISSEPGEHVHLEGVMQSVLKDLMVNPEREKKYKKFLSGAFTLAKIWRAAGLPDVETRFRAFILTYVQQRLFDDIIDGDTPEKVAPADRVAYAQERLERLRLGNFLAKDPIDAFAVKILTDIRKIDSTYEETAKERLGQIMESILFDGERILEREETKTWKFVPYDTLNKNFYKMDIEGVIGMSLFLFGFKDSERNMQLLEPLGSATRISYNLRDFHDDIEAGLCNIAKEDTDQLEIKSEHLQQVLDAGNDISKYPDNIKTWLRQQAERGQELLRSHAAQPIAELELQEGEHAPASRLQAAIYRNIVSPPLFNLVYAHSADRVFKKP